MARRTARFTALLLLFTAGAAVAACPESSDSEAQFGEARRLQTEGKLDEAIVCQERGLAYIGATLRAAQERQALAKMLELSGRIPESVELLKRTLPEFERLAGPDSEGTGDLLRQLGWAEYAGGSLPDAEAHLRRSHSIYLARLGARHLKVAKVLNNLGVVVRDGGRYEEAEALLATALDVARNGLTPDDDMCAVIYNNVAGVWYYRGNYRRAVQNYQLALPIFVRLYGEHNADVGITVNNLGSMYEELGDYASARTYYARALAIQEKLFGPMHPNVAAPVSNLAVLAHSVGDLAAAEPLFRRAIGIYESVFGPDYPTIAESLVKYGALKHQLGDDAFARNALERALRIQQVAYGADSNWAAQSLNELGPVYQSLGQTERAKDSLARSIGIAAATAEQQMLLDAYGNYADVLAANGQLAAAAFYGKFAVNLAQEMRNDLTALGRSVQKSFLAKRQHYYRDLADRLITLGRLAEAEQVMTMLKEEEYFDYVRVALRSSDGGSTRADFSAAERPYADKLTEVLKRLAFVARESRSAGAEVAETKRAALMQEQGATRLVLASTASSLSRKITHRQAEERTPARRELVASGTALVRYLVTDHRVRMIVTTASETHDTQVKVDLPRLNRLVFELRQALQNPKSNPVAPARALHRLLIAPIEPALTRNAVSSLEIELDGALRYVPFATLHDGRAWLVERFDVRQRTLATARPAVREEQRSSELVGFGVTKAVGGFAALPSVGTELDRIVLRGPDDRDGVLPGVLILDEAFTEASFREALGRGYSLVHVASHFVFRPGPLSDSYLLLGNGSSLTLEQLRDRELSLANVRLLTLSACSTALGEAAADGGELESFGVLAQKLGAREVLASLWPVADRSTSMLMLSMYRAVGNTAAPTARALRQAQLALLKGEPRFAPYAHPFYWAPFILMSSASSGAPAEAAPRP